MDQATAKQERMTIVVRVEDHLVPCRVSGGEDATTEKAPPSRDAALLLLPQDCNVSFSVSFGAMNTGLCLFRFSLIS